jgi:ABC-2 type transport system permease protein
MKKFFYLAYISIKNYTYYLKDFLITRIFLVIVIIIFSFIYKTLLGQNENFASFTLPMLLYYLAITESIEMSKVLVNNKISEEIKSGTVAYILLRPISYISFHISSALGEILIKQFVTMIIGFLCAFVVSGFQTIKFWMVIASLPAIYGAILLNLFFMVLIGMFAFYIEETRPIYWIYQKFIFILGGLFVPLEFFPPIVLKIFRFFPFTYMNYFAAKMSVMFDLKQYLLGFSIQVAYILIVYSLSIILYSKGIKRVSIQGG